MKRQVILLLIGSALTVAAPPPSNCTFSGNDSTGVCRNVQYCAEKRQQECYVSDYHMYVCCREENILEERPSQSWCDDHCKQWFPVVNGESTKPKEFPYMVALGWETEESDVFDYKCGGVLIGEDFLMTAAHCAYHRGRQPVVVLLGGVNLTDTSRPPLRIAQVIVHPDYSADLAYNDIALMKIDARVDSGACLGVKAKIPDKTVTAIGYGHTKFAGRGSDHLLKADLNIVTRKQCKQHYEEDPYVPRGILRTQLCAKDLTAGRGRKDTCQGDSGGPIIVNRYIANVLRPYVVGITSFAQGCAHQPPGVYTRVSSYIDWIESIVWPEGFIGFQPNYFINK